MITREQIEEWKRLADAVTPGPWTGDGDARSWSEEQGYASSFVVTPSGEWKQQPPDTGAEMAQQSQDARFIAAARTAVPALIAEVEALRALLREVEWRGRTRLGTACCPLCGADTDWTHTPDCRLAAALK